jgi:hypothetical protein
VRQSAQTTGRDIVGGVGQRDTERREGCGAERIASLAKELTPRFGANIFLE